MKINSPDYKRKEPFFFNSPAIPQKVGFYPVEGKKKIFF